ncbi:MAG TPA: ABC transporter ATP-binding protein [Thermoanaerobaculaceae bacterium]|nr:ABC transporter ATP-binding protein [Thermoanaerobaculaceae bacterium]
MQSPTVEIAGRPVIGQRAREVGAPDPSLAVCTRRLAKDYVHPWTMRRTRGLEALDLEVGRGEVLGLLGPNGAGKTTTLKLLVGLLKPTRGRAWLLGHPVEDTASRRGLGFLPEQPYFYDYLNGVEYLELAGRLSGLGGAAAHERARQWLGRVGLGERPRLVLRKYSKGMLQRLGLAAALVHEPELLILDEPMSGLDPFGRRDVRGLIAEQRDRGVTVLFSSHILPDVEMLCDRVAILLGGRLTQLATVGELVDGGRQSVEIRCAPGALLELPRQWAGEVTRSERADETVFRLEDESRLQEVLAGLLRAGVAVRAVTPQRPTLEELFLAAAAGERTRRSA